MLNIIKYIIFFGVALAANLARATQFVQLSAPPEESESFEIRGVWVSDENPTLRNIEVVACHKLFRFTYPIKMILNNPDQVSDEIWIQIKKDCGW